MATPHKPAVPNKPTLAAKPKLPTKPPADAATRAAPPAGAKTSKPSTADSFSTCSSSSSSDAQQVSVSALQQKFKGSQTAVDSELPRKPWKTAGEQRTATPWSKGPTVLGRLSPAGQDLSDKKHSTPLGTATASLPGKAWKKSPAVAHPDERSASLGATTCGNTKSTPEGVTRTVGADSKELGESSSIVASRLAALKSQFQGKDSPTSSSSSSSSPERKGPRPAVKPAGHPAVVKLKPKPEPPTAKTDSLKLRLNAALALRTNGNCAQQGSTIDSDSANTDAEHSAHVPPPAKDSGTETLERKPSLFAKRKVPPVPHLPVECRPPEETASASPPQASVPGDILSTGNGFQVKPAMPAKRTNQLARDNNGSCTMESDCETGMMSGGGVIDLAQQTSVGEEYYDDVEVMETVKPAVPPKRPNQKHAEELVQAARDGGNGTDSEAGLAHQTSVGEDYYDDVEVMETVKPAVPPKRPNQKQAEELVQAARDSGNGTDSEAGVVRRGGGVTQQTSVGEEYYDDVEVAGETGADRDIETGGDAGIYMDISDEDIISTPQSLLRPGVRGEGQSEKRHSDPSQRRRHHEYRRSSDPTRLGTELNGPESETYENWEHSQSENREEKSDDDDKRHSDPTERPKPSTVHRRSSEPERLGTGMLNDDLSATDSDEYEPCGDYQPRKKERKYPQAEPQPPSSRDAPRTMADVGRSESKDEEGYLRPRDDDVGSARHKPVDDDADDVYMYTAGPQNLRSENKVKVTPVPTPRRRVHPDSDDTSPPPPVPAVDYPRSPKFPPRHATDAKLIPDQPPPLHERDYPRSPKGSAGLTPRGTSPNKLTPDQPPPLHERDYPRSPQGSSRQHSADLPPSEDPPKGRSSPPPPLPVRDFPRQTSKLPASSSDPNVQLRNLSAPVVPQTAQDSPSPTGPVPPELPSRLPDQPSCIEDRPPAPLPWERQGEIESPPMDAKTRKYYASFNYEDTSFNYEDTEIRIPPHRSPTAPVLGGVRQFSAPATQADLTADRSSVCISESSYMDASEVASLPPWTGMDPQMETQLQERASQAYLELDEEEEDAQEDAGGGDFEDEPLYQIYHADVVVREYKKQQQPDEYEETEDDMIYEDAETVKDYVSDLSNQLSVRSSAESCVSVMSTLSRECDILCDVMRVQSGVRKFWKEMPEVMNQGLLDQLGDRDVKLQESLFEILTSEASYLKSLNLLVSHFLEAPEFNPSNFNVTVLKKREQQVLFSNILAVRAVSRRLMKKLKREWLTCCTLNPHRLAVLLAEYAEAYFQEYVKYVGNQTFQERELDKLMQERGSFKTVLDLLQRSPRCHGLAMRSFLLLPMQRVTRLPLLVEAVAHRMEVNDPGYQEVQHCLSVLQKIGKQCNERVKQLDNIQKVAEINAKLDFKKMRQLPLVSEHRSLVKMGELSHIQAKQTSSLLQYLGRRKDGLTLILFNDLLLITKKIIVKKSEQYQVIDHAPRIFTDAQLVSPGDVQRVLPGATPPATAKHLFMLVLLEKNTEYLLSCTSQSERVRWTEAIHPPEQTNDDEKIYEEWDCPQVQAIYRYEATEPDELTLEVSDVIKVYRKIQDGWYEGERIRDGERGWFPSNFTEEIQSAHTRTKNLRLHYRLLKQSHKALEEQLAGLPK